MKYLIVFYAFIFGLFVWIFDSAVDSFFFYEDSFLDLVVFNIPKPELFFRAQVIVFFTLFGLIISYFFSKQKKAEESLREMSLGLEKRVKKRAAKLEEANQHLNKEIEKFFL